MTSRPDPLPRLDLFLAAAVVAAAVLPAFMTGALAVQLRVELGTTPTIIGLAVGAFFATSALCSTPVGHLVERMGAAWGMRICAAGSALVLGSLALLARSPTHLVVILAAGGVVNTLSNPSGNLLLARTMPPGRRGLVFGIKQSAIPIGTFLAGLAVPGLALTVGWRWAFLVAALAALVLAISVPERPAAAPRRRRRPTPTRPAGLSTPALWAMAAAATLAIFGGQALGAFLVSFGVESGIGEGAAGWLLSLGSTAGIVSRIASGWEVDRRGGGVPHPGWGVAAAALLLVAGTAGFALLATGRVPMIWLGDPLAFAGGWGLVRPAHLRGGGGQPVLPGRLHRDPPDRDLRGGQRGASPVRDPGRVRLLPGGLAGGGGRRTGSGGDPARAPCPPGPPGQLASPRSRAAFPPLIRARSSSESPSTRSISPTGSLSPMS